ncbi:MAG: ATP-dependent Clp protease ATP-binding subunit [Myxococcales bacterium]|nr:ATP-dependent Clp protease ATP-binding subunit [Myxococcales bacterium]
MSASLRVWFTVHHDGRRSGLLLRGWSHFFEQPPPSAYGDDEAEVLALLQRELVRRLADGDQLERYLWTEPFHVRQVNVPVHPLSTIRKRPVVGHSVIPLHVYYAYTSIATEDPGQNKKGPRAYRVMVPRMGVWAILEDLDDAADVLRTMLSQALLGEAPRWVYDFRSEGEEYVREWSPPVLVQRPPKTQEEAEPAPEELGRVSDDLCSLLTRNKLPVVVGDPPELAELRGLPARTPLPSLLLVGPAGVGKTALVRRLTRLVVEEARKKKRPVPPRLWSTSADRILAGMVYLGQWQERCLRIVEELSGRGEWLHVERLLPLLAAQHDGTSIADLLDGPLAAREIALVTECTEEELERESRRHASFLGRFTVVHVREPSPEATLALLVPYVARTDKLILGPRALERLVRHAEELRRDQALPGKAFRFVDWLAQSTSERRTLHPRDVSVAFAAHTGVPVELIADEHAASADTLARLLRARVIGQDEPCAAAARVLARFKAGMSDPERPLGVLLFSGPTGVGKTELAKQIARVAFGDASRLLRFDMSEFALRGSAQRLLEAGEGATSLVESVRRQPLSVVLFDEIEKAHPEVLDVLLAAFGEGRLTDSAGALVDFRSVIAVMTSNLGVRDHAPVGFGEGAAGDSLRAVRAHFRPELWNRIDRVLSFRALSPADVRRIVDLMLAEIESRPGLVRRGITLATSQAAKDRLAELGYDPSRGARPLARVLDEKVVAALAAELAAAPALREVRVHVVAERESVETPPPRWLLRV